ncbi:MAG: site-specific DNA-methyltransferase [Pseudomonas sp.]|uniref:DNA methyltransferase n=1 Tax=Pseudomonas sp. TaxID=306 RepID=UPI001D57EE8A|nr:DNA methyltransferase [Pseudomonas sp.]MPT00369.1 site-specific DNA-methyltransferase [Pseudomonas sp.]
MARQEKRSYDLSEAEQRDLFNLIQQGKSLPEKYRFILFEDKREVELVWNGKTRDVSTTVLPFQTLEHIDEPRAETKAQEELFDSRGRQMKGWSNKLIWGDNKLILSSLKAGPLRQQIEEAGGLKLIYIDPPFDVGADFSMDIEIGGETFHKEPNLLEQIAYRDTWGRGADSFVAMIYERLALMHDLLARDGSIFLHCDWRVSAYLRMALDEIFGRENFRNELYWYYYNKMPDTRKGVFPRSTDTILWYAKDRTSYHFQALEEAREKAVKQLKRIKVDGRMINARDADGNVMYENRTERVVDNVWRISMLQPADKTENLFFPTQKPEALVRRILEATTKEGDLVADFFVGSGTTAAVAEKMGRKWIATDLGKFGIHTTRKRLIGVQRQLKSNESDFRAFEVLNLGRYERQAYLNVGGRLSAKQQEAALAQKEREFRELILRAYKASPLGTDGTVQDGFFHGARNGRLVVIGPINLPVGRLFVEEVITECRKRGASRADILAFEFEMGLFPAVLEEARSKGIDLGPKYIPAEVFDKRAVDKGQVVFHDISFVEANAKYEGKNKLGISIELADFSVYYTQGAAEAAIAALKDGKSDVICERGQLYKVSKSKEGVVSRERLTKHWTDWVDYWAVDFDYLQRKEIIKVPVGAGLGGVTTMNPASTASESVQIPEFEEHWTGGYIFENEWQSFRTRHSRELELKTATHTYDRPGRYTVAVKVIDIFGNDTMTLVPVNVG